MTQIHITDLNPSDFGLTEELTDKELLAINGGRVVRAWWEHLRDYLEDMAG